MYNERDSLDFKYKITLDLFTYRSNKSMFLQNLKI